MALTRCRLASSCTDCYFAVIFALEATTVPSLHRSQVSENFDSKEYVIDAGSGSRICGADPAAFWDKNCQQYVSILSF
jgi:hypothetical protein